MSDKTPYSAFFIDYMTRQSVLVTDCAVKNPYGKKFKQVNAIWDTGATHSVVTPKLATFLNLAPIDKVLVKGVHGEAVVNSYIIELALPNRVIIEDLKVSEAELSGNNHVLIGMDVIGIGDFSVCRGQVISYCIPSFKNPINFVEKANKINE